MSFTSSRGADVLEEDTLRGAGVSAVIGLIFGSLKAPLQSVQSPFVVDTHP